VCTAGIVHAYVQLLVMKSSMHSYKIAINELFIESKKARGGASERIEPSAREMIYESLRHVPSECLHERLGLTGGTKPHLQLCPTPVQPVLEEIAGPPEFTPVIWRLERRRAMRASSVLPRNLHTVVQQPYNMEFSCIRMHTSTCAKDS
jgi:hypothetical protein